MERHLDGVTSVTGAVEWSPYPHCAEGNGVDEDMGFDNILNEGSDIIIDKIDLKNSGKTVDTTFWRKQRHRNGCQYFGITSNIPCHDSGGSRNIVR